jgi:hypothetical protein
MLSKNGKSATDRYRVSVHNPWKYRLGIPLLLLAGWGLFYLGELKGYADRKAFLGERAAYVEEIENLTDVNSELLARNAQLERSSEVEHNAYQEVKDSLNKLQDELLELQKEVAFYQSIVSPSKNEKGLRIQSFQLTETGDGQQVRYSLVLTKSGKNDRYVNGNVEMRIIGSRKGKSDSISVTQVSSEAAKGMKFRFRYFQNLEGNVTLPDGYEPDEIEILVKPTSKGVDPIEVRVSWAKALAGGS